MMTRTEAEIRETIALLTSAARSAAKLQDMRVLAAAAGATEALSWLLGESQDFEDMVRQLKAGPPPGWTPKMGLPEQ